MKHLEEQVAVVTGGGRGIGRAIVNVLFEAGAQVMTCGRGERPEGLDEQISWCSADVSSGNAVKRLKQLTVETLGPPTILINNAGIQIEKTVVESTDEDWDAIVGINCRGVFNTCRAFIPGMLSERRGAIVNIGSISGEVSDPSMAIYNASKSFVHALTRSIAVDHGPDIRCNAIRPGWINTGMADAAFELAYDPEASQQDALARHAMRRLGTPEDIARAVLWLVSDDADFVTGQCFTVDGGLTAASPLQPGLF